MHRYPSFLLLSTFALLLCASLSTPEARAEEEELRSPAEAAREAFKALQKGGSGAYETLVPSVDGLRALFTGALEEMEGDERKQAKDRFERRGGLDAMIAKSREKALLRFERAREEAGKSFAWKDARYVGLDASHHREMKDGPLTVLQIQFLVRAAGDVYAFGANDAVRVEGRWCFPEGISYRGPAGGRSREMLESAQGHIETLRRQLGALEAELVRVREQLREAERGPPSPVVDEELLDELVRKRREAEAARDEAHRQLEEQAREKTFELESLGAKHEMALSEQKMRCDIAELERDNLKARVAASEERLQSQQDRERRIKFALESMEAVVVASLDHTDEMVRLGASILAQEFGLEAARPHFEKLLADTTRPAGIRLGAARFLADTGSLEGHVAPLEEMLRSGVGAGAGEDAASHLESLLELLKGGGVAEDEITRLMAEGAKAAKQR